MKAITLRRLTLENFKGIRSLSLDFPTRCCSIYGDNATGKTTIMDAYLWLLTGKDSRGNAAFDIKPLDAGGNVRDRSARSSVEAWIDTGENTYNLRREYYELWTTKRGSYEASYDGNSTDYSIDGVPKTKRQFDDAVASIVPVDLLRLLSDTAAFALLKWQDRRSILFDVADVGSDREIMALQPEFAPLIPATTKMSLDDYQLQLTNSRKKCNGRLKEIPARIEENKKTVNDLENINFKDFREKSELLERAEQSLAAEIANGNAVETSKMGADLHDLQNQLERLEINNEKFRAAQPDTEKAIAEQQKQIRTLTDYFVRTGRKYHETKDDEASLLKKADDCRTEWISVNTQQYSGSTACPTCGQKLPAEQLQSSVKKWDEQKKHRLDDIAARGQRYKELAADDAKAAEEYSSQIVEAENLIAEAKDRLASLEALGPQNIQNADGYAKMKADLQARISTSEKSLSDARQSGQARTNQLREKQQAIAKDRRAALEQLAKQGVLEYAQSRIRELEQERKTVATSMEDTDRMLDLIDQFTRFKSDYITGGINQHFRIAEFRLFNQQVNGGLQSCCDILGAGVPYDSGLNNGARINVGLDIIQTLSEHYGYSVPIFVDNAESVTHLADTEGQLIRLIVSPEDHELRCEF
ncbi:MAG: AAA family ATPase [Oscillospiraceae bacterium]|nr:AAA family ATPase [Oscillospiraceae bacterium]